MESRMFLKFKGTYSWKENLTGYSFVLPQILLFLVFMVYPIFEGIRLSLYKVSFTGERFAGLDNYKALFSDPVFMKSVSNTIIFVVCIVALTLLFALFVASAIFDKNSRYVSFIRGAYYIPIMVSMVVMSMVWNFLLNPAVGLIPYLLSDTAMAGTNFFGDRFLVLPTIIFITFTTNVGQAIILYIAAMIGISGDVLEAASIDGATRGQKIFKIIIPLVKPTTLYLLVINIINSLKIFVVIQLLTDGGPNNATVTMMYYLYMNAFKFDKLGVASAIGVIMFAIALVLSLPQVIMMLRKEQG